MREMHEIVRFIEQYRRRLAIEGITQLFEEEVTERTTFIQEAERFKGHIGDDKLYFLELDPDEIMSDPYLKDIKIPNVSTPTYELNQKRVVAPNSIVKFDENHRSPSDFKRTTVFWYSKRPLAFPILCKKGSSNPWMTVEPYEINSAKNFINSASGNILLGGLGLGYLAYMLSLKPEVTSITVVELDQEIIDLFNRVILPQFGNKDKIKIVHKDILEYLDSEDLSQFDEVNVDVWQGEVDMLPTYLECIQHEEKYPNVKFSYWLENQLKCVIQDSIMRIIVGIEKDHPAFRDLASDIIDDNNPSSFEDMLRLIKLDNFREIMRQWAIKHSDKLSKIKDTLTGKEDSL